MNDRHCPVDGAKLIETEQYGAIVDQCPVCRGIWCDRGELETMVDTAARALAKLRRNQPNRKPFEITNPAMRQPGLHRTCPNDGAGLVHRERHGVAVDLCPLCLGIWLDEGELQAIINLTADCFLQMGPNVDLDTVPLPLGREPDRRISSVAANMPKVISRKEPLVYGQSTTRTIDPDDVLDIFESLTSFGED